MCCLFASRLQVFKVWQSNGSFQRSILYITEIITDQRVRMLSRSISQLYLDLHQPPPVKRFFFLSLSITGQAKSFDGSKTRNEENTWCIIPGIECQARWCGSLFFNRPFPFSNFSSVRSPVGNRRINFWGGSASYSRYGIVLRIYHIFCCWTGDIFLAIFCFYCNDRNGSNI